MVAQRSERQPVLFGLRRLRHHGTTVIGGVLVLFLVVCAAFAPILAPHDPRQFNVQDRHHPPSSTYWLGTDAYGRDIASRLMYGARVSILVGVTVVLLEVIVGVAVGLVAGYAGRATDAVFMRITDVFMSIPGILLALAIMAIRGPSFGNIVFALAARGWTSFARLVRSETLTLRERDFVTSARALGCSNVRIIALHILPNLASTIVVYASLRISIPILSETALSYLGLGLPLDVISWGGMIRTDQANLMFVWWPVTFPGLAIMLTVLGFNLVGDGIRDILDPTVKRSH